MMRLSISILLASVYVRTSFGGTLEVIDYDGQCLIWSKDNHGCTGYSAPFAELDGEDCSKLSEVINGVRQDFSVLNVDACGTENGLPAASIEVKQTGLVTFFNQNGDKSSCMLGTGLKVGSLCTASDYMSEPSTKSAPTLVSPTASSTHVSPTSSSALEPSPTSLPVVSTCGCSVV